ncbi:hypothetical protein [Streptomyces sp. NBC_00847]|uniref:hypothetical protein n=1 Tax=Streptomyces sp. NBC_00847 TaxID=2975850 RepID=UPI00225DDDDE|nr:hypothetical protein [Streptomyces sp. NBC_00847]MCX4885854.1 hypothetical protein [Streptomyces sp. NBC_00847]
MSMEFPFNLIQGRRTEDDVIRVYVNVQSEYTQIDETGLAHTIQAWLSDNVEGVTSTAAERHEQLFPVTPLPSP